MATIRGERGRQPPRPGSLHCPDATHNPVSGVKSATNRETQARWRGDVGDSRAMGRTKLAEIRALDIGSPSRPAQASLLTESVTSRGGPRARCRALGDCSHHPGRLVLAASLRNRDTQEDNFYDRRLLLI